MTYDLDPGRTDYLATAIELGNNSLGNQSPTELVAEIAKAIRDCPNGARIVVEDMTSNRSELLPCPFCGSSNIEIHADEHHIMLCITCGATGPVISFDSPKSPQERWNTRAPNQPLSDDVVERAIRELKERSHDRQ